MELAVLDTVLVTVAGAVVQMSVVLEHKMVVLEVVPAVAGAQGEQVEMALVAIKVAMVRRVVLEK